LGYGMPDTIDKVNPGQPDEPSPIFQQFQQPSKSGKKNDIIQQVGFTHTKIAFCGERTLFCGERKILKQPGVPKSQ
jgi:hypothetical protein